MRNFLKKLFAALGIEVEAIEGITEEEAIALVVSSFNQAEDSENAVELALSERKITGDEVPWALALAREDLQTFQAFARYRDVQVLTVAGASLQGKISVVGEIQAAINGQLGVSPETFCKYNGTDDPYSAAALSLQRQISKTLVSDETQDSINKMLGVSAEAFVKYNSR